MAVATIQTPTIAAHDRAVEEAGVEARAVAAALRCIARFGVAKTTLDDVAREAGCSRATLYRYFDSKAALLERVVVAEGARVLDAVTAEVAAAATFVDAIVAAVTTAADELRRHDALRFLLEHEPDAVLVYLAFAPGDRVLLRASDAIAPAFARWCHPVEAARVADWLTRVVRAYAFHPDAPVDLTDEAKTRRFLETLVIPGLTP